jgi:hypothetical protein
MEGLLDKLWEKGFIPLFFTRENTPTRFPRDGGSPSDLMSRLKGDSSPLVQFPVNNALFIKAGHPLFQKYHDRNNCVPGFMACEPVVEATFFARPLHRQMYSMEQVVEQTERLLSHNPA